MRQSCGAGARFRRTSSSRSRDSFAVNITRNVWSCRSLSCLQARGGRPGGNILDFVALMEGCSIRDAALRLQHWSGAAPGRFIVPRASRPDPAASENPPLRFALQYVDSRHPYLTSRGVTPETVRTFGLACTPERACCADESSFRFTTHLAS